MGKNHIPGMDRDQDSYRSELCGMLGNVIMVNAVWEAFRITKPHMVIMACDNKSALWKTFCDDEPRQSDASSDILLAILHQLQQLSLLWKDGNICPLTYLRVSEPKEMLGLFLAPDGNDKAQLKN